MFRLTPRETSELNNVKQQLRPADPSRRRIGLGLLVAALLVIPLIAMQMSDAVAWRTFDFLAAAVLLTMAAVSYEVLIATQIGSKHRYLSAAAVIVVLILAWGSQI
jgi:hypothetical protein